VGVARERSLPEFHRETLVDWFEERGPAVSESGAERKVLLFPDTYTNHNHPDAGKATVRVLEAAGVHVRLAEGVVDSGRAPFSKGFLDGARERAEHNVAALAPRIEKGWDVVVAEPSDAVMFQLDYLDLLTGEDVQRVASHTYGVMEYINARGLEVPESEGALTYHGHCHQKAMKKDLHAAAVLERAGYEVDALDSGCCGMAGSFGYEADHYAMSRAIGSILVDQVETSPGRRVVAPGASCRTQIGDLYTGEEPPHPIEVLAEGL
jgi:Fe-S oxidoreductase